MFYDVNILNVISESLLLSEQLGNTYIYSLVIFLFIELHHKILFWNIIRQINLSKDKVDSIKCPLRPLKNEFLFRKVKCFFENVIAEIPIPKESQKDIFQNVKYKWWEWNKNNGNIKEKNVLILKYYVLTSWSTLQYNLAILLILRGCWMSRIVHTVLPYLLHRLTKMLMILLDGHWLAVVLQNHSIFCHLMYLLNFY